MLKAWFYFARLLYHNFSHATFLHALLQLRNRDILSLTVPAQLSYARDGELEDFGYETWLWPSPAEDRGDWRVGTPRLCSQALAPRVQHRNLHQLSLWSR